MGPWAPPAEGDMAEVDDHPTPEAGDEVPPPRISVELSADAMLAQLDLAPGGDGAMPTLADVQAALAAAGVVRGIDETALALALARAEPQLVAAARGQPPQPGADTRFELLVNDHRDRAPKIDEHGLIDFRELGDVPLVEVGQPLMRRIPPTAGVPGWTVRGQALPAPAGHDEPFHQPLAGAAPDPAEPNLLRAASKGQPVRVGNGVMVESVFRIPRVDMASGNINFDGTVQIDGDVLPGMKVHAGGDIVVQGTVEGGELQAAGDIHVGGGAIARAQLRAGGGVVARFLENAVVHAGHTIAVSDTVLHSELHSGGQISVGTGSRGRLAGGRAQARLLLRAANLGAPGAGCTKVQVGVDPLLEAQHAELVARLAAEQLQAQKLETIVQRLVQHGDPQGLLRRAQASFQQAQQTWAHTLQEKMQIEQQLAGLRAARVELAGQLDGDIELAIGARLCRPGEPLRGGRFALREDGHIVHTDPRGITVPVVSH